MTNFKTADANVGGRTINADAQDADRIQGIPVTDSVPVVGDTLVFDDITGTWKYESL